MIRGLILYYLSIKPTHGYEMQRFIQLSGTDQWTKIQSGSIYYALSKLEKEKNIIVKCEEQVGSRVRKIYEITEKGRKTLEEEIRAELASPLMDTDSPKMVIEPILAILEKPEMERIIKEHITKLYKDKEYFEHWRDIKSAGEDSALSRLSFDMVIHSLVDQIKWHEELLQNLDVYIEQSRRVKKYIQTFEVDNDESVKGNEVLDKQIEFIESLKFSLERNPEEAAERLKQMLIELKKGRAR